MGAEGPAVVCENGHALGTDDKFCRTCGAAAVETPAEPEEVRAGPLLCTNGHEVADGRNLCTVCGAPVEERSRSPREASTTVGERLGSWIGARSRRSKLLAGVGAAVLVLVIVVVVTSGGRNGSVSHQMSHQEYIVADNGTVSVYDQDHAFALLRTFSLGSGISSVRGVAASAVTGTLYVSYGPYGGSTGTTGGHLLAYDLVNSRLMYDVTYPHPVDSFDLTPDGKTIYLPYGECCQPTPQNPIWYVINAATGSEITTINTSPGGCAHDTAVSLDGQYVFMGDRCSSPGYLIQVSTTTNQIVRRIGPLHDDVLPFTFNAELTRAYTISHFFGFQVSDITTGTLLYTVPISGFTSPSGYTIPDHGIALSPNEREIFVIDSPNCYVHVFNNTVAPPAQVADIHLRGDCPYLHANEGWLNASRDGRYVFVGQNGSVIDTTTNSVVTVLAPMRQTKMFIEIDWANGRPVFTMPRESLGYGAS